MSFKPWCAAPSHPLVIKIAEKYGLSKKNARTVLNNARKNDPAIQSDNITFEYLESQDSFKEALGKFVQESVDENEKMLIMNVPENIEDVQDYQEELRREFNLHLPEDEVEDMLQRRNELGKTVNTSKVSTANIIDILKSFDDTRRLEFLGTWICRYLSEYVTNIDTDPATREDIGVSKRNNRADYFTDTYVTSAIRTAICDELEEKAEELSNMGNEKAASELRAVVKHFDTLLYMYGSNIFRTEGVSIGLFGNIEKTNFSNDSANRNDNDQQEDDDDEGQEMPVSGFSASEQSKSVSSKIMPSVKVLLANIRQKNRKGEDVTDAYGYGLHTYLSVPKATDKLLTLLQGKRTFSDMMAVLERNARWTPWMNQLITALNPKLSSDYSGEYEVTSSKKEQLQSMFFQSFKKQFTHLRSGYQTVDTEGNTIFVNTDANVSQKSERLMRKVLNRFRNMAGIPILKDGMVNFPEFEKIRKELPLQKIKIVEARADAARIAREAAESNSKPDYTSAYEKLSVAETNVMNTLKKFGIEATDKLMNESLGNSKEDFRDTGLYGEYRDFGDRNFEIRQERLGTLIDYILNLNKAFIDWNIAMKRGETTDTPMVNPLRRKKGNSDYKKIYYIRNWYDRVLDFLTEFTEDGQESRAYINGKAYYSWNNPSSIMTMIEALSSPDKQSVQNYIKEKYGQDRVWFLKEGSTSEAPHFYSDWLEEIFHGGGRNIIGYSEKPVFCGNDYEKQSDTSYALSILNDYFTTIGMDDDTAWYRVHIASDKPRYSSIKWRRYSDNSLDESGEWSEENYHNVIARKAVDFFAQELKRGIEVVDYSKTNGVKQNTYDISFDDKNEKIKEKKQKIREKLKSGETITASDLVHEGRYIFRGTGASFYLNKFINDAIEAGAGRNNEGAMKRFQEKFFPEYDDNDANETRKEERKAEIRAMFRNFAKLGDYVVDRMYNKSKDSRKLVDEDIMPVFKGCFHYYMNSIFENFSDKLYSIGMYDRKVSPATEESGETIHLRYLLGSLLQWHTKDETFRAEMYSDEYDARKLAEEEGGVDWENVGSARPYWLELAQFRRDLEEFVYNNWLAKTNMSEILDIDLAFYGSTPAFQKRNAQIISAGYVTDTEAKIHGKPVSDGTYRSITIQTSKEISQHLVNIEAVLNRTLDTITDPLKKRQFKSAMDDTLNKLRKFDPTDGQAFTSLTGLRKRMAGQGEWSRSDTEEMDENGYVLDKEGNKKYIYTDEAVYRRFLRGETKAEDFLHVFAQPQKPFVFTFEQQNRKERGKITVPVQHKNSEYALIFLTALTMTGSPVSQTQAIFKFMEESAQNNQVEGIDTVNFDSGVKIGGNSGTINLFGLNGQQTMEALEKAVYGKKGNEKKASNYQNGVVTQYDASDYKIQQVKPEHFKKSAQPMGSQLKILAINNINDEQECTLPDGTIIKGKELKQRYFSALRKKMRGAEAELAHEMGLRYPHDKRLHRLSTTLKKALSTDQKFGVESRRALSITKREGVEEFVLPLDDPGMQGSIEPMLYSKIRRAYYKEKTNGGIVVQATSWGATDDLHIRFYSDDEFDKKVRGGILATYDEFKSERGIANDKTGQAEYKKYVKAHQQGYAYFEAEVPMQDYILQMLVKKVGKDKVAETFLNKDGSWKMDEIRKVVPDSAFDAISYRVPTEAKYSMMVCRIKSFSPENSGSVAKYPKELTEFTGSDFDIDTDTIELRPNPDDRNRNYGVDNELFDLQLAALRSTPAVQETFMSGDFSDLSQFSYYVTLLNNGFSPEQLHEMSSSAWKTLCEQTEDLDLMDPTTDVILHRQNSDAKDMIAIAAVGVTSHAFHSLYNDIDLNNPERNPSDHPENFIRTLIPVGTEGTVNYSFNVINDSAKDDGVVTQRFIGGEAFLDMMHDMDGRLISTQLSRYVGASADAAKDPAEYRLNLTTRTLPIAQTMHRLGISSDVIKVFIAQPVIRDVVNVLNSASETGYVSIKDACKEVRENIAMENEDTAKDRGKGVWNDVIHSTLELKYSDLEQNIYNPGAQSVFDKFKILHIFETMNEKSSEIGCLDAFPRYNSAAAMRGTTFLDRYATRQKLNRLQNLLSGEKPKIMLPQDIRMSDDFDSNEYGRLCTMYPYVAQTILGEQEMTEKIILENMRTYNAAFFEAVRRLHLENDAASMKALYTGWKNYLLFVGDNRIANFYEEDTVRKYTRDFAEHFAEVKDEIEKKDPAFFHSVIENNTFIDSIGFVHAKEGYGDFDILSTNISGMTDTELEQYKRDWESLLNHPQTRQLAIDTAIHFLARAAAFDRSTPVHIMPLVVKEAIPNYIKAFADAGKVSMTEENLDDFILLFARNNSDNRKVVPHFWNRRNKVSAVYVEDDGIIRFVKENAGKIADWIDVLPDKSLKLTAPVVKIDGQLYLVLEDKVIPETGEGSNAVQSYVVKATPITPLGIPNQLSEYTMLENPYSLYLDVEEAPDADNTSDNATIDGQDMEEPHGSIQFDGMYAGSRTGTYLSSSPYDEAYSGDEDIEVALAKDRLDKDNTPYLESRTHLRRVERLADAFGIKIESTTRMLNSGVPYYTFNLSVNEFNQNQHQRANELAAFIYALGYSDGVLPVVRSYTSNPEEANAMEFRVPLKKELSKNRMEQINKYLYGQFAVEYNASSKSLIFTSDHMDTVNEDSKKLNTVLSALRKTSLTDADRLEFNYLQLNYDQRQEHIDTLTKIRNGQNRGTEAEGENAGGSEVLREFSPVQEGEPIRLEYLADLAIRRLEGEPVAEELREIFNERRFPLASKNQSYQSTNLATSVFHGLEQQNLSDMLLDVFREKGTELKSAMSMVDNIIINTANWILAHRSRESLLKLYQQVGYDANIAEGVINEIETKLKELDIC